MGGLLFEGTHFGGFKKEPNNQPVAGSPLKWDAPRWPTIRVYPRLDDSHCPAGFRQQHLPVEAVPAPGHEVLKWMTPAMPVGFFSVEADILAP